MNIIEKIRVSTHSDDTQYDCDLLQMFLFGEMGEALDYFRSNVSPRVIERMIAHSLRNMQWGFDDPSTIGCALKIPSGIRILRSPLFAYADKSFHKNALLAAGFIASNVDYYHSGAEDSIYEEFEDLDEIFLDDLRNELIPAIRSHFKNGPNTPMEYLPQYFSTCTHRARLRYRLQMVFDHFMVNDHPPVIISDDLQKRIDEFCRLRAQHITGPLYYHYGILLDKKDELNALATNAGFVYNPNGGVQPWINYLDRKFVLYHFCR